MLQHPIESPEEAEIDELVFLQDISRMERDLANLESQIQLQQQSVETKEASMEKIRDQISQVASRRKIFFKSFCERPVAVDLLTTAQVLADERRGVFRLLRGDRRGQHQGVRAGTPEAADRAGEETVEGKRETEALKQIQQGFYVSSLLCCCFIAAHHPGDFRFEFQSHCGRLNMALEYNQNRLEQEKKKCRKIEENVEKEERTANELKKVEK